MSVASMGKAARQGLFRRMTQVDLASPFAVPTHLAIGASVGPAAVVYLTLTGTCRIEEGSISFKSCVYEVHNREAGSRGFTGGVFTSPLDPEVRALQGEDLLLVPLPSMCTRVKAQYMWEHEQRQATGPTVKKNDRSSTASQSRNRRRHDKRTLGRRPFHVNQHHRATGDRRSR